ncbi:endoplasmic reticulum-based factor for assembly of V-ATPase-domain-containing protein [Aspergillus californicus]
MVLLSTTPPILSAFNAIPPSTREDLNLPESLSIGNPISHDGLIHISRYFREQRNPQNSNVDGGAAAEINPDRSLDSLLRGMKLYVPPPPPKPEPSPEYLASKARLLAAAESDAYNRMLAPQSTPSAGLGSPHIFASATPMLSALHDTASTPTLDPNYKDPLTPSLVLNIFLSVLITGFSVYWALTSFQTSDLMVSMISSTWSGPRAGQQIPSHGRGASEPVRVLLSLFAALAVGVAEVLIYAIYLSKIEQARGKEGRIRERKEVVTEEVIASGSNDSHPIEKVGKGEKEDKDEEVIWGRGPNGGLRRRVREKWEEDKDLSE